MVAIFFNYKREFNKVNIQRSCMDLIYVIVSLTGIGDQKCRRKHKNMSISQLTKFNKKVCIVLYVKC